MVQVNVQHSIEIQLRTIYIQYMNDIIFSKNTKVLL